jgi:hypothetical protein
VEIERPEKLTAADLGHWPSNTELTCACGHMRREHANYYGRCDAKQCPCSSYQGSIPTDRDYLREDWLPPIPPSTPFVPQDMTEEEALAFWGGAAP